MTDSFNLTSKPWLPCERMDGSVVELSTRDALVQAHQLRRLVDSSPAITAVLHRHLLAILHRAYQGPRTIKEWTQIADVGAFDVARIEAYLTRVQDRMDLFHPTHPFAQTRGLIEQFEVTPIDELTTERSGWGGGREIFQHRPSGFKPTLTPAEAARALLAHHGFATGGLVKKPGEPTSATATPLLRGAVVLLCGETLFQTLIANLLRYDPGNALPFAGTGDTSSDLPSWEQDPPPRELRLTKEPTQQPAGWLDLLTWLSRRIELVCEGDLVVSFVRAVGKGLAEESPRDPMIAYKIDEKKGYKPIGIDENRVFWRDAHAFFEQVRDGKKFDRPRAVEQAAEPEVFQRLGASVDALSVHGISAYQSALYTMRTERIGVALRHLNEPDSRDVVERAIGRAEEGVKGLRTALWNYASKMLSEGSRQPDSKDIRALVDSFGAEPAVWSALGVHFSTLLHGLDKNGEEALSIFFQAIQITVREALQSATARADSTARSLQARVFAECSLNRELSKLFPSTTPISQENSLASE